VPKVLVVVNLLPERSKTAKARQEERERERIERNIHRVYRKHGADEVVKRYGNKGLKVLQAKGVMKSPKSGKPPASPSAEESLKEPVAGIKRGTTFEDQEHFDVSDTLGGKIANLFLGKKKEKK